MANVSFCPKCGAAVKPDFEFCTSCGFALSGAREEGQNGNSPQPSQTEQSSTPPASAATPAQPAQSVQPVQPVQATPIPQHTQPLAMAKPADGPALFSRQVHIIIIALILAGLGAWIWSMESANKKGVNGGDVVINDKDHNTGGDDKYPPILEKNKLQASDFAGTWRAYESNNPEETGDELGKPENDLFVEVDNGRFTIYPRNEIGKEPSAQFTCGEVSGNLVTCSGYSKDDEDTFTLKMELEDSKDVMTMTIIMNQATETMILKLRRL